ncbi:metalloproteinase inhibitor 1-like [Diadema setosum]|uniref:metalloproteinase inhibitor 1-like n=1 Tax=Diadema setosum TaxID=31175 RepID=UPI003B3B6EF0
MAPKSALISLILFIMGMICVSTVTASCASCPIQHPQQKFCSAHFVFKVRPKSVQYIGLNGKPVRYSSHAYDVEYQVKVETIFKGEEHIPGKTRTVSIYSPRNVCNIDTLEMGVRYLISGRMRGDKMEVTTCGMVEKWSDLTPAQRRGIRGAYGTQCSSCRIRGSTVMSYYGGSEIIDEMSSGLWSKQDCFYNPLASVTFGSEDCENKHSFCMKQADGGCAWEGLEPYNECFRQREYKWQLMQFAEVGLAAWTCPEQCKNLSPRRLKYKCKKATRKLPPCSETREAVRTFAPDTAREIVRTVDPSSIQESARTAAPLSNVVTQSAFVADESPEIVNALSPMFDREA